MLNLNSVENLFIHNDGIMKANELLMNGLFYKDIDYLMDNGYIEKIKRGYYQWQGEKSLNEVYTITHLFPDGIFCMDTALQYYGYINRTPNEWCITVDRNSTKSRFNIDYPFVKPYYVSKETLSLGESVGYIDDVKVKIYSKERVICDCLKRSNKMDSEVYNQAIQSYIRDESKNIPQLIEIAQSLKVMSKVRNIIGVWLWVTKK